MKYAGIGSRETPDEILSLMCDFAFTNTSNLVLRSGGALGADKAFERGAAESMAFEPYPEVYEYAEIYWPWSGYGEQDWGFLTPKLKEPTDEAYVIAQEHHPAWHRMGRGGHALHARNCHIVLGERLDDPVDFIICWTPGGKLKGGTAQALRLAATYEIEIHNLALPEAKEEIQALTGM